MKKTKTYLTIGSAAFISITMTAMFIASPIGSKIEPSSFSRKFEQGRTLIAEKHFDLPDGAHYLAGSTKHTIYVGNLNMPFKITSLPISTLKPDEINIKLIDVDSIQNPRSFKTTIDSPIVYLSNGVMPEIFRGTVGDPNARRFLPPGNHYFVDAIPISPNSFMLKSYSSSAKMHQLAKRASIKPHFKIQHGVLEKQIDGMIDVAGEMHADHKQNKLIYLYTYRNQYIVMDTNLNIEYRANTIDTFSRARVKIQKIESKDEILTASPPTNINNKSFVYNDTLYIQSNLLAKNELLQRFEQGSIIDKYALNNGTYIESFYIPNYRDRQLNDFIVTSSKIVALYNNTVVVYTYTYIK